MVTGDILLLARQRLQDTKPPYLWDDWELFIYLNLALAEWATETGCVRDETTPAYCTYSILANQPTYSMSPKIREIHYGHLLLAKSDVTVKNDIWVSQWVYDWKNATGSIKYLVPDYGAGKFRIARYPGEDAGYYSGAFVFTALTKTIAQVGTDFTLALKVGDEVVISGTTLNGTTAVPQTFTVVTVSSGSFTVAETVVNESASAGIIQKITDTLSITVTRLPADLTKQGMNTEVPEIATQDHPYLVDGIMREAYLKKDSDTLDPKASVNHGELFELNKLKARWRKDNLRYSDTIARPNYGAL